MPTRSPSPSPSPSPLTRLDISRPRGRGISDLHQQLAQYGLGECVDVACDHDERAWSADDVPSVIVVQPRLDFDNRQAVDGDACGHRVIPSGGHVATLVVAAVTGNIDHLAFGRDS